MRTEFPKRVKLRPGQVLHFRASRGTVIAAAQGTIRVLPAPKWLGEQLIQMQFHVREGEAHLIQGNRWVEVRADSDTEVFCTPGEKTFESLLTGLVELLAGVLRRPPSRAQ